MSAFIVVLLVLDFAAVVAVYVIAEKQRKEREAEKVIDRWCDKHKEYLSQVLGLKASKIDASKIVAGKIDHNAARIVFTGHGKAKEKRSEEHD